MVGFPGETEEDFRGLYEFVDCMEFERLGVFAFSPEPGTPAFDMDGQVPPETADRRARELMRRQHLRTAAANSRLTGQITEIMVDEIDGEYAVGRRDADAPEIDQNVYVVLPRKFGFSPGDRIKVRITAPLKGGDLEAEVIK